MEYIDLEKFEQASLRREPFSWIAVPGFVRARALAQICASYPRLKGGSYALESLEISPVLQALIGVLDAPAFEDAVARKFDTALAGRPKFYSLRGYCRLKDGKIHTDSMDKIITVLVYFHETWEHERGRLRLLRDGRDMENYAAEISPAGGTLLAFRRSARSWHGHPPFEGVRRALQMNWMESQGAKGFSSWRHRVSAWLKG